LHRNTYCRLLFQTSISSQLKCAMIATVITWSCCFSNYSVAFNLYVLVLMWMLLT